MIGDNIKKYRILKNMSLRDLAKELSISQTAVAKYEKNDLIPDGEKLLLLSKVFNCSIDDLLKKEHSNREISIFYKKKDTLKGRKLQALKQIINDRINDYLDVLELNEIKPTKLKIYEVNTLLDLESVVTQFRDDYHLGIYSPLINLIETLENIGINIITINDVNDDYSGFEGVSEYVNEYPFICILNNKNNYLKRLTIAHELAHLILKVSNNLDEEDVCEEFARLLLLPKETLQNKLGFTRKKVSFEEYEILQNEFEVSIKEIIKTIYKYNIINKNQYKLNLIYFNKYILEKEISKHIEIPNRYKLLVLKLKVEGIITESKYNHLIYLNSNV